MVFLPLLTGALPPQVLLRGGEPLALRRRRRRDRRELRGGAAGAKFGTIEDFILPKIKYFLTFFAGDQEAHAAPEPQDVHLRPEGALLPPRQAGAGAHWVRRLQLAAGRARVRRGGVQGPGSRFSFLK